MNDSSSLIDDSGYWILFGYLVVLVLIGVCGRFARRDNKPRGFLSGRAHTWLYRPVNDIVCYSV